MPLPTEPWVRTPDFYYNPADISPNGERVKRPGRWNSGYFMAIGRDGTRYARTAWPPGYVFNDAGEQVCGFWIASRSTVCATTLLMPNGRCHNHGGIVRAGQRGSSYRGGDAIGLALQRGRYNPYLPERILERFEQAESDPEILSVKGEMSLMTVRIQDVIDRLDQGEAGELWSELRDMVVEYRREPDRAIKAQILARIFEYIFEGAEEYIGWQEIQRLAEQRRKLSETEQKRMVQLRQYMTAEQAMYLTSSLADIVVRNVTDPDTLERIRREFAGLITSGRPGPNQPEPITGTTATS
jgi:hypothetical protein